ncbi:RND transporter [Rickettsia hoogstraalii]|nr:RND transporter [Rickettsia hoogstraalii]
MRGKIENFDEAISGVCYYFMRLPRSLWLLAMTIRYGMTSYTFIHH